MSIFSSCEQWIVGTIARLRGRPVPPANDESWDYDEEAFIDDDTPPEIAAQHIARQDGIRSDVLDDDTLDNS